MLWHKMIGTGPEKVIAVHGWFGDHRAYAPMLDLLDQSRCTWAFPDIPCRDRVDRKCRSLPDGRDARLARDAPGGVYRRGALIDRAPGS